MLAIVSISAGDVVLIGVVIVLVHLSWLIIDGVVGGRHGKMLRR